MTRFLSLEELLVANPGPGETVHLRSNQRGTTQPGKVERAGSRLMATDWLNCPEAEWGALRPFRRRWPRLRDPDGGCPGASNNVPRLSMGDFWYGSND